jgi:hypothetical protein
MTYSQFQVPKSSLTGSKFLIYYSITNRTNVNS